MDFKDTIQGLLDLFIDLKGKKRFVFLMMIVALAGVLMWLNSAMAFTHSIRMRNEIETMSGLLQLEHEGILLSETLEQDYQKLLMRNSNWMRRTASSTRMPLVYSSSPRQNWFKALSGASPWILIAILMFFTSKTNKWTNFVVTLFVGGMTALIGVVLPTILTPWVNYLGWPLLQIALMVIFTIRSNRAKAGSTNNDGPQTTPTTDPSAQESDDVVWVVRVARAKSQRQNTGSSKSAGTPEAS